MVFKSLLNVFIIVGWIAVWVIATRRIIDDKDPPTCDGLDCDSCPFPQCSEAEKERRNKAICNRGNQILDALVDNPEPVRCAAIHYEDGFIWVGFGNSEKSAVKILVDRYCHDTNNTPEELDKAKNFGISLCGDEEGESVFYGWFSLACVDSDAVYVGVGEDATAAEKSLRKYVSIKTGKHCSMKRLKTQFHVHTLPAKLDSCEMLRN